MSDKYKEIGEILAAARRDQNKSVKDASEITKIMEQYLTAIEAGEPEKLPSEAYFQLFARSYAQYLGLDSAVFDEIEVNDSPNTKLPNGRPDEVPDPETIEAASRAQARKFARSLVYLAVAVFIVFIAFIIYSMFWAEGSGRPWEHLTSRPSMDHEKSPATDDPATEVFDIKQSPYEPHGKLKLQIQAKQDVWTIVVRDGDTVLNRRLDAGDERAWEANYRYHLTIGISSAVDLYINNLKLAPLSDQARTISGLEINQVNYKSFLPPPIDTADKDSTDGH